MRGPSPTQQQETLTVSEFTQRVKQLLETQLEYVRIEGELSQLTVHRSGHVYLSLKDPDARLDGVIWRFSAQRLTYRPEIGENVIAGGRINVYAPHGSYKLVIDSLEPAGLGARQAAFEKLKAQLLAEGLFESSRKQVLPRLPRRVGVITSPTGAARRDIESVIFRRSPQIPIVLYPCNVQGDAAVSELVKGLRRMDQEPHVDVIIIGRGGGSIEDLWAFNCEPVARAIAACRTPVVSAVGHETDVTIADFVSDRRAATPSAAAEIVVPVRNDLLSTLDVYLSRMSDLMARHIERRRARLYGHTLKLGALVDTASSKRQLLQMRSRLDAVMAQRAHRHRRLLHRFQLSLQKTSPQARILEARQKIQHLKVALDALGHSKLSSARADFRLLLGRLHALSPIAVLERGYSIVKSETGVVTRVHQLKPDDEINVLVYDGAFSAKVLALAGNDAEEN
ncbi:MAG: exodeoxyribonuclease VII large subunit [Myxococcota bacterium]|nr:exodeoxyribonuclease VII large subunit [Myxococcota bacterium]